MKEFFEFPYIEHRYEVSDSWEFDEKSLSLYELHEEDLCFFKKKSGNQSEITYLEAEFGFLNDNIDNKKKICDKELQEFRNLNLLNVLQIDEYDDDYEKTNGQVSISTIENNNINHVETLDGKYEKGFIINDIVALGRMRAVKKENKIYIKTKLTPNFEIDDLEATFTK